MNFVRTVNEVVVEQRRSDGFINATAMCVAYGKNIADWFRTQDGFETLIALVDDLGLEIKYGISHTSSIASISTAYPTLVVSRMGSPENGGGTWIHPDIAIYLAQWCYKPFAIQVSRWIKEWLIAGTNPIYVDIDKELSEWKQRHSKRVELKDEYRPELMEAVIEYASRHNASPITLCWKAHDAMNERIQGCNSKQIRAAGELSPSSLIRDHFASRPLDMYKAVSQIAKNKIVDYDIEPVKAVHEACDVFLGKSYKPMLAPILENVYREGHRLKSAKKSIQKRNIELRGTQLSLFDTEL